MSQQNDTERKIAIIKSDLMRYQNGALTTEEKRLVAALKRRLKQIVKSPWYSKALVNALILNPFWN
ncbi:hypothetical protein [Laceyella tengchongensis]|uniref:hypothetical protein n=1 Tax=Laceyella tengchongensis TaxID=574699 RepID=UPI0012BA06C0|nr:hypothetical protein [Laceyella tengchongensis]